MDRPLLNRVKQALADPQFLDYFGMGRKLVEMPAFIKELETYEAVREDEQVFQRERVRAMAIEAGYRIMHRRRGQYWLLLAATMSLDAIEELLSR
jgi:hypothetical protein